MRVCTGMFWSRKLVKFPAHIASKDWVCEEELKRAPPLGLFVLTAVASAADVLTVAVIATVLSNFLAAFRGFFDTGVTSLAFEDCLRTGEGVDGFADREDRPSGVIVTSTLLVHFFLCKTRSGSVRVCVRVSDDTHHTLPERSKYHKISVCLHTSRFSKNIT